MPKKKLTDAEAAAISSPYLDGGRKQESWQLSNIEIEDKILRARVRLSSGYASPTDGGRVHLTIFATLEFLSQLAIIYMHVWNGYTSKTREAWMVECAVSSRVRIRNTDDLQVEMHVTSIRKMRDTTVMRVTCRVTDGEGLFEAKLKGAMS